MDESVCLRVILLQLDFGPVGGVRNLSPRVKISLSVIYFDKSYEHLGILVCEKPKKIRACSRKAPDSFWAESSAGSKVPVDMCQKFDFLENDI